MTCKWCELLGKKPVYEDEDCEIIKENGRLWLVFKQHNPDRLSSSVMHKATYVGPKVFGLTFLYYNTRTAENMSGAHEVWEILVNKWKK